MSKITVNTDVEVDLDEYSDDLIQLGYYDPDELQKDINESIEQACEALGIEYVDLFHFFDYFFPDGKPETESDRKYLDWVEARAKNKKRVRKKVKT